MSLEEHPLRLVLAPRSVAVVGASADPGKRGFQAVRALLDAGFPGRIVPVNPRGGEILGLPVARSLDDLPEPVELALVCTPAASVAGVVEACGRAGVGAAVLLAVGFGEAGSDGARLEDAVARAGRASGVRLVGPNTSGVMNLHARLNLIGVRQVRPGGLGLLVQSGNLALDLMLAVTRRSAAGISVCVGVGNEVDLGFADFLDALGADGRTRAVLLHAEGFRDGPGVVAAVARVARSKPVVFLKAARGGDAAAAARSHTGAVAGPYPALRAALRQAGAVEAVRSDELLHLGETLASQPPAPPGSGVAVLSDGGGQGTLAVDALDAAGVPRASLGAGTRAALRELLGPAAGMAGPVDLAGAADGAPERFAEALGLLSADPGVGTVLVVGLFGGYALRFDPALAGREEEAALGMARAAAARGVGLVVHTMYAPDRTPPLLALGGAGVPVIESLEVACRCAGALLERGAFLARAPWAPSPRPAPSAPGARSYDPRRAAADPRPLRLLPETEARDRLGAAGVPLVPAVACASAEEAVRAARDHGGAVVLKLLADGVAHKSDVGGVAVGVQGDDEVRRAFRGVTEEPILRGVPAGAVRGVLVAPHLPVPVAELLVGVRRDRRVGTVLTVGAGGLWVELLEDVALRVLPVDGPAVRAMLDELRTAPVLRGARGRPPADVDAVVEAVLAVAALVEAGSDVAEAEVNPLFVYPEGEGALAVDARVHVLGTGAAADPPPPQGDPAR